jgi:hypothetical protein
MKRNHGIAIQWQIADLLAWGREITQRKYIETHWQSTYLPGYTYVNK